MFQLVSIWSSMGNTKALSDCLVDALVAWGDAEAVAERMSKHRADAAMRAHVLGGNRTSGYHATRGESSLLYRS